MYLALILFAVAIISMVAVLALALTGGQPNAAQERLQELSAQQGGANVARTAGGLVVPPSLPSAAEFEAARRSRSEQHKLTLRDRLVMAGLYRDYSASTFMLAKVLLAAIPLGLGVAIGLMGIVPFAVGLIAGAVLAGLGTIAPSFWLDFMLNARQGKIRRSLPDALDVIVVCMEGGMSVTGAFTRVGQELASAHPLLASELRIVVREVQMGRSLAEALRAFAKRFDVEELRSLAGVVSQAEKYGSSVAKALNVYSDSMRVKRYQNAEKLAHQASVKMMFPTLFCIFPAIFIVILGPAAISIYQTMLSGGFGGQ